MGEVTVEDRGRVIIPKAVRDKLGIRGGEKMKVKEKDGEVVMRPVRSGDSLKELKGVVKKSDVDPMEVKEIWSE